MKPTRLILIPALSGEPAPYLIVGVDGFVLERGTLALDALQRPEPLRTVAVAPGADVLVRWLDLPAGGRLQQRAAALWAVKDDLAAPADRLAAVLGGPPSAGEPRLAVIVGLSLLDAWVDYLDALGVRADVILPDALTLDEPGEADVLTAVAFGPSVALRGRGFAASVQPDLVDLIAAGRPVDPVTDPAQIERALVAAALAPPVNLLDARTAEPRASRRGWTLAAGLAAAVVLSPLLLTLTAASRDEFAARSAENDARAAIAVSAPELAGAADPVEALRARVRAAPPPGGVSRAAAALFAGIEGIEGAELDMLIVDPEAGMKAGITHAAYEDMQVLDRNLRAAGLTVTQTGAADDAGRVVSDITVGAAQ